MKNTNKQHNNLQKSSHNNIKNNMTISNKSINDKSVSHLPSTNTNNNTNNNNNNNNNNTQQQQQQSLSSSIKHVTNKQTQKMSVQQRQQNKFSFKAVDKDMQRLISEVIDSLLKQRHTILLAKLAKQKLFPNNNLLSTTTTNNLTNNSNNLLSPYPHTITSSQSLLIHENPLITKSIDQINHYYCTQISTQVVKKIVNFMKHNGLTAKIVSTSMIIDNIKSGYNFGGLCFWNYVEDGQKTITRKVAGLDGGISERRQGMVEEGEEGDIVRQAQNVNTPRETLLIVTVYLLKYEQSFRSSNNSNTN